MLKNFKPIVIIAGDPKSIFLEIYFKSLKKNKFKNPLILIVNENILLEQMRALKYDFKINNFNEISFDTKRNLLTSSSEFYNLSYNYINDCLKAGIAYRREFYTDRDIEPTNKLMFTISIIPFADINSPSLSK